MPFVFSESYEIQIAATADLIFNTLANLEQYHLWLPESSTFISCKFIDSAQPSQGARYIDNNRAVTYSGTITKFKPNLSLIFEEAGQARLFIIIPYRLQVYVDYSLQPLGEATRLVRDYRLTVPTYLGIFGKKISLIAERENQRILNFLKTHIEQMD